MAPSILKNLSMPKYGRLLPRVFPGALAFEVHGRQGDVIWRWDVTANAESPASDIDDPVIAWSEFGAGVGKRSLADGKTQFRSALRARSFGKIGWLVVTYDTQVSVPMATAPEPLRRAFADASLFFQEEIDLQAECDQLAVELTERYEELNLVYSTDDQVEYIEEGQEALTRLVHNCADYLDVGMAALICRDRDLSIHELNRSEAPQDPQGLLELLGDKIYDRVESQLSPVVLNELDEEERHRLLQDRSENLVAYPITDDHGTAIGLIAVVARKELHTFSNGDRNLLEVMAKKASRIIHTHHDSLTGLMNRSGFESSLVVALGTTRTQNVEHCILHIDVDQLHVVNDLMGYQEGDSLIRRVARVLRQSIRETDCLARLGGDEFGVLLTRCELNEAYDVAREISASIRELEVISASKQLNVTASIGIASMTRETEGIVGILAAAEIACKSAKEAGRDGIQVFAKDNTTLVRRSEEIGWIGRVQQALRDDAFRLYCQKVSPLSEGAHSEHFEILLRMQDEDGSILSPAAFMPAAERYQLMPLIDRWVIRNSLKWLGKRWSKLAPSDPVFCINLSGQSLTNTGFLAFIVDELDEHGVPPANVCFEITETAAISNIDDAITLMDALKSIGCRFSLDDFGAGLSSFGYLKKLPVNYLKIDGGLVREITTDKVSLSMVRAICSIGATMGLHIVAEYVGDMETANLLREIGADFAQGFGIGKPAPISDIVPYLQSVRKKASA